MKSYIPPDEATIARFWSRVEKTNGCWYCLVQDRSACVRPAPLIREVPYFHVSYRYRGRSVGAHRFAYEITYGPVPDGLFVRHRCGVRCCVNPTHLTVGTRHENYRDDVARHHLGIKPGELLTYEEVPLLGLLRPDFE